MLHFQPRRPYESNLEREKGEDLRPLPSRFFRVQSGRLGHDVCVMLTLPWAPPASVAVTVQKPIVLPAVYVAVT